MDKMDLNNNLCYACEHGDFEKIKYLLTSPDLEEHADIHADNDWGLTRACANGHLEVVKYLLTSPKLKEHSYIHASDDLAFVLACYNGHLDVVNFLVNNLGSYDLNNIKNIKINKDSKIPQEYVFDMIKVRDLKNQLSNEVSLKKNGSEK